MKKKYLLLALILALGAFLRLYRIADYMTFLGDEGRDVLIVRRLLVNGDLILIGPGTSIGNMYLGPLYYYFMAPGLFLANYSPVGPAVEVALLGVATIGLVFYVTREWFSEKAAFVASFFYAISPTVIYYSRSSWNPNIMPFFALLMIYAAWKAFQKNDYEWLIVMGISFAFVLQSHYLGLLLAPIVGLFWLLKLIKIKKFTGNWKLEIGKFLRMSLLAGLVFAVLMSPLVVFDIRHGFRNFEALKLFFLERQTTVSIKPWKAIPNMWPLLKEVSVSMLGAHQENLGVWIAATLTIGAFWLLGIYKKNSYKLQATTYQLVWILVSLLGLGLYKQQIYEHYYGFFYAAPFILGGAISAKIFEKKKYLRNVLLVGLVYLAFVNFKNTPILLSPNMQYPRTVEVAEKIEEGAKGEKFNLAVIAERNYEDAYQYFLEKDGAGVTEIDSQLPDETITDQLFVVCELVDREKCDPTHSPKAEVANFGWTAIESEWEVGGVVLYKLQHVK